MMASHTGQTTVTYDPAAVHHQQRHPEPQFEKMNDDDAPCPQARDRFRAVQEICLKRGLDAIVLVPGEIHLFQ